MAPTKVPETPFEVVVEVVVLADEVAAVLLLAEVVLPVVVEVELVLESKPVVVIPPELSEELELPICGGVINKTAPSEQTAPVPIINARFTCSSFLFPT